MRCCCQWLQLGNKVTVQGLSGDRQLGRPKSGNVRFMEKKRPSYVEQIPRVDWKKLSSCVQELVEGMAQQIAHLRKTIGGSSHSPRTAIRESQSYIREFIIDDNSRPTGIWVEAGEKETFTKNGEGNQVIQVIVVTCTR